MQKWYGVPPFLGGYDILCAMELYAILGKKLRDIPVLNTDIFRLISYVTQPEADLGELERMMKMNQALCSQVLRLANSSYFKRARAAETLKDAIQLLGLSYLRRIFMQNFYSSVGRLVDCQQAMFDHGQECAKLGEFIARTAGCSNDECSRIWMGGLLHDIGRLFLSSVFPGNYEKVNRLVRFEKMRVTIAETKIFEHDHQQVGVFICEQWNFPDYLREIVKNHHDLAPVDKDGQPDPEQLNILLPVFCANNFLDELDETPFQEYLPRLQEFFKLRGRECLWEDPVAELKQCLKEGSWADEAR